MKLLLAILNAYTAGNISWEASLSRVTALCADPDIYPEEVSFEAVALPKESLHTESQYESWLTTPYHKLGVNRIAVEHGIGLKMTSHYEGMYVFGEVSEVDSLVLRLRNNSYDNF